MPDYDKCSMEMHRKFRGKIEVHSKVKLEDIDALSTAYTPGVAAPSLAVAKDPTRARELTIKSNTVAIVSDGSAVLGLGNLGGLGALPVMEGKAILFKTFANIDAWPICLATQETDAIVETVKNIAPVFGGINLEDISAPRCFEIEQRLQDIGIPVFHDDQHGTAVVSYAAFLNAVRLLGKKIEDMVVVISGAGAAGIAIAEFLKGVRFQDSTFVPVKDVILCDSKGVVHSKRDNLNAAKRAVLEFTNNDDKKGSIHDVLAGTDLFIGVSVAGLLTAEDIQKMNRDPIVLAMANPIPEIMPDEALAAGAAIVGTGRSDFSNQVNNVLGFPGIFRGALDAGAKKITPEMKLAAARALAEAVEEPTRDHILPNPFEKKVPYLVGEAVAKAWQEEQGE